MHTASWFVGAPMLCALSPLHAVVPPVDDVEADEVEREEHPARLINPEARDAFATTSIITLGTIHK